jgi:hypothetical protein
MQEAAAIQAAVIDRALRAYVLMRAVSEDALTDAREKLESYIGLLFSTGEHDLDRLTVYGLAYLRERDADISMRSDYTGL